jgi:putative acetyltransferase
MIRPAAPSDAAAIRITLERAFGRPNEADLVEKLQSRSDTPGFVALVDDCIVGHVLFTPVTVENEKDPCAALALGPMAVRPDYQNRGVGSRLVRFALDACRRAGHGVVFVLGHPRFYPRFGFEPSSRLGIQPEFQVPEETFMVRELHPGALEGVQGVVRYLPEFREV